MIHPNASTVRLSAADPCAGLLGGLGTGRPSLGGAAAAPLPRPVHGGLGIFLTPAVAWRRLSFFPFEPDPQDVRHALRRRDFSLLPMAELPPVGTVVWMKTNAKPVRARIHTGAVDGEMVLRFDDPAFGSDRCGHMRLLLVAAFWSALDHVEGA